MDIIITTFCSRGNRGSESQHPLSRCHIPSKWKKQNSFQSWHLFFSHFLLSTFYDIFYLNFIPSLTERLLLERKNFSATLVVSSSWYKNYIDTWQINRRESNLIPYRQELHKNRRFLGSQAIKAYVVFWAKEKGLGIWDFKEETNDLQKDMKINVW